MSSEKLYQRSLMSFCQIACYWTIVTEGGIRVENGILDRKSNMRFHTNWQQESQETEKLQLDVFEKENETHLSALMESRQHALQLERAIEFLQIRVDELISEKTHAIEESNQLKDALAELSKTNESLNSNSQQLERKLSIEIYQKTEIEQEINALYKQFDVLKNSIETQKQALTTKQKAIEDAQESLKNEKELNQEIKTSFNNHKDEIEGIRQHFAQDLQDSKEMKNLLAEAVLERAETQKTLLQLRREYDRQQLELLDVKERLGASLAREKKERYVFDEKISNLNALRIATESKLTQNLIENEYLLEKLDLAQIQNDLHDSHLSQLKELKAQFYITQNTLQEEIHLLEEQLQQASQEIALLHNANDQLQQEIITVTVQNEEKQLQLDEAQQHLAKKVRECALLNENIEEFLLRESEARNGYEALQQANILLHDDLQAKDKKIKEYIEKIVSQDKEILKWEDKWRESNQARHILEEKIQDLSKIEQRHTQLQNLLLGFGNVPSTSSNSTLAPQQETRGHLGENENIADQHIRRHPRLQFGFPIDEDSKMEVTEEESLENAGAYPNLFDIPQMKMPPKQNLFD